MAILSIDAGTTGVTALLVGDDCRVIARGYSEFPQYFPQPGWVEHSLDEIWNATLVAVRAARAASDATITAIGITNQRETIAVWDRASLIAPRNAIVWQDRRTAAIVDELRAQGVEAEVRAKTGLGLDPYFSSSKLLWLSRNEPTLWADVRGGRLVLGTIDTYLIARLTGGRVHVTDATNASRTQLVDLRTAQWDPSLLELFDVPANALPRIVSSIGIVGETDPDAFLGLSVPIGGIAGDQQAALFGQTCFEVGETKCTYGTGAFILMNTGSRIVESRNGLLTTIALQDAQGALTYALEGSVFVAGAAVQWLRDGLGIISSAEEIEALARSVASSEGVVFVPALAGLGAPYWDPSARGTIIGLTRGSTKAHIARATLEAIAFQVKDVVSSMGADSARALTTLRVDGGAARNDLLLQIQADVLGVEVSRGAGVEMTGLGAAYLAGIATGIWSGLQELRDAVGASVRFTPQGAGPDDARWKRAVERSRAWAD